jgi:hypothetical protein
VRCSSEELAHDERCPPMSKHLARNRHWAELSMPSHAGNLSATPGHDKSIC